MSDEDLTETYLTRACKEVKNILQSKQYMIDKCKDTLKDPLSDFILDEALELRHLARAYTCSVYHTCKEVVVEAGNLQENIIGIIYIDFHHKRNKKDGNARNELDVFGRNILKNLRGNFTLNGAVEGWSFKQKDLWQVNQTVSKSDKMPEEKVIDWVGSITLHVYYTENFHNFLDG